MGLSQHPCSFEIAMPNYDDYGGSDDMPKMDREPMEDKDHDEEGETTALLPKSILAGKKFEPGDEVILKVVRLFEDEVEVEYSHGEDEDEKPSKPKRTMDEADESLDRMAGKEY